MEVLRLAPATGPPAGRQRRGSAEGCRPSASHGAPPPPPHPHLARRGEVVTKTRKLRPALSWSSFLVNPCRTICSPTWRGANPIPRGKPPNLARRGEVVTKTQKLRSALPVDTQPNHVLPLAHFGAAIPDVYDGGVVRTDHHDAGERSGSTQQCDLKFHHASVGGW
jgi:hypothetical protein